MNKETIVSKLNQNPKYDAGWVDYAADILSTSDFFESEVELEKFTSEQLSLIKQALTQYYKPDNEEDKKFLNILASGKLNFTQMQILLTVRSNKVRFEWIEQLADENIPYAKLNYIAQGMIDGFNMFTSVKGLKKLYDVDQTYELFAGMKSNVDWETYEDPAISAEKMGIIRHALELGAEVNITDDGDIVVHFKQKF